MKNDFNLLKKHFFSNSSKISIFSNKLKNFPKKTNIFFGNLKIYIIYKKLIFIWFYIHIIK